MANSTWSWIGGTGAATIAANWTLLAGPGNPQAFPQAGDTAIDATGIVLLPPNANLIGNTLEIGGTAGTITGLFETGNTATSLANPTFAGSTVVTSAVPGDTAAETTLLSEAGVSVNEGTILADGPAGSTFTIAISATTLNGVFQPGYAYNTGVIQADAGNTLTINIGSSSALFNVGTIVSDGGTVVVSASTAALAGGFMPVRGFYDIEGGGTIITAEYEPASDGTNGSHEYYQFLDSTPGDTLKIENVGSFGGVIAGFSVGDTIDLGTLLAVGTISYSTATNFLVLEAANGATLATLLLGNGGTGFASGTFAVTGGSADGLNFSVGADGDTVVTTTNAAVETSGTSGAWQSPTTWANGIVPGSTASPTIGLGATAPFTVNTGATPVSVGGFGVRSTFATVDVTSNLTLTNGLITDYQGTVDVAAGNTVVGQAIQLLSPQSAFTLAAGATLELSGRLNQDVSPVNGIWPLQPGQNPFAFSLSAGTADIDGALLAGPSPTSRGGSVSIGYESDGSATVIVNPGATVTGTHTTLGSDPTSSGTLVVDGASYTDIIDNADTFNSRGEMLVGYEDVDLNLPSGVTPPPPQGAAQLVIENNATVTDPRAFIAEEEDSAGTVTVSSGGVWNIGLATGGYLAAADGGQGALFIEAGGTVNVGNVGTFISNGTASTGGGIGLGYTGGTGTIMVSGAGALLTTEDGISVGRGGQALLAVQNGGTVQFTGGGLSVGAVAAAGASGTVVVGGTGASAALDFSAANGTIPAASGLTVGGSSAGTLIVADNGAINLYGTSYLTVGSSGGVYGDMIVGGTTASAVVNIGTASLTIGNSGTGVVTVNSFGTINETGILGAGIEIAQNAGASGTLIVNGGLVTGAAQSNGLYMGLNGGSGVLTIENQGTVSLAGGSVIIGQGSGASDTVTVDGNGSLLQFGGSGMTVGLSGNGMLDVASGGTVNITGRSALAIGEDSGASGTVIVNGGLITEGAASAGIGVGMNAGATGSLSISGDGTVLVAGGSVDVGNNGGAGSVSVQGTGELETNGTVGIIVGNGGSGTLNVSAGGLVSDANGLTVGFNGGGNALVSVSGGTLTAADITVAQYGNAALTVSNGGKVFLDSSTASVISSSGESGTVTVAGAGSLLQGQTLIVGQNSSGTLYVQNSGSMNLALLEIGNANAFAGQGTVAVTGGGEIETDSLIIGRNSTLSVDNSSGVDIGASGSYVTGAVRIETGYTLSGNGLVSASVVDNGAIDTIGGSTLEITGAISGTGSIYLGSESDLKLDQLPAATPIVFGSPDGETLILNASSGTIGTPLVGLNDGDRIEFAGLTGINGVLVNGSTVTVETSSGNIQLTDVSFAAGATQSFFFWSDGSTGDWAIQVSTPGETWSGSAGTSLGNAANWNPASVPDSADGLTFNNAGTLTGSATGLNATFNGTNWLLNDATLTLAGAPSPPYQPYAFQSNATSLIMNGGALTGGGSGDVDSASGSAMTIEAGAQVSFEGFGVGDEFGDSGSLLVTGAATALLIPFAPVPGGDGGYLNVGGNGGDIGQVTITGGATVNEAAGGSVGFSTGSQGTLTVSAGGVYENAGLAIASNATSSTGTVTVNGGTIISGGNGIQVGGQGTGVMSVTNGTVTTQSLGIGVNYNGPNTGGSGTLTVGSGGVVIDTIYGISIGQNASGTLVVNGGSINSAGYTSLGNTPNGPGIATISGGGSWTNAQAITIGNGGSGTLTVGDGSVTADGITVAGGSSGTGLLSIQAAGTVTDTGTYTIIAGSDEDVGVVTINGPGAELNSNDFVVGNSGTGYASVSGGGTVNAGALAVGQFGVGSLTVGTGGLINITGTVGNAVGNTAGSSGLLTIDAGGTLQFIAPPATNVGLWIGENGPSGTLAAAQGTVVVTGAEALLSTDNNPISVGQNGGSGSLTVSQGGSVAVGTANENLQNALIVGANGANSSGTVTVAGAGSELTVNGFAAIGGAGTGTLSVNNDGTFLAQNALLGSGGIGIGYGSSGSSNDIGGSGIASVTGGGVLDVNSATAGVFVGGNGVNGTLDVGNGGTVIAGATLVVGNAALINGTTYGGTGIVNIGAGGTLMFTGPAEDTNFAVTIGNDSNIAGPSNAATGIVNVSGAGALLDTNGSPLAVGLNANGTLDITQGGTVTAGTTNSSVNSAVAVGKTANGTLLVSDPGSELISTGFVYVGRSASGNLIIQNHGSVVVNQDPTGNANVAIGNGNGANGSTQTSIQTGGSGTAEVTTGGDLYSQEGIYVGMNGASGTLTVNNSGTVEAAFQIGIGRSETLAAGGTLITNSGTTIAGTAELIAGQGTITVGAGGLLKADGAGITAAGTADIVVGAGVDASGVLNVTGAGATVNSEGYQIAVGQLGNGTLTVSQGGTVLGGTPFAGDDGLAIAVAAGIDGSVTVTGSGSFLNAGGQIAVGVDGTGTLSIENGGSGQATQLVTATGPGSSATVTVAGTGSVLDIAGGATFSAQSVLNMEGGTIDPTSISLTGSNDDGGTGLIEASQSIDNTATLYAANGTLTLSAPIVQAGSAGGTGVLQIDSGGDLVISGAVDASQSVDFAATGTLTIGDIAGFQATVSQFGGAGSIVVQTSQAATFSQDGSLVSVIANGATLGDITFASAALASYATATPGALQAEVICFVAGTRIATPTGEVPVEKLAAGDRVTTLSGAVRPITWIGKGRVLATRGQRSAATPVIVRKGALGKNVPHCDLHVTKGHALYLNDVLIPVEFLVNHRTVYWDDRAQEVSIYHIELETHDVLLANGAPAESYRDDGNRWLFQNANTGWGLPPQPPCAPVLTGGPIVDAAWRQLLDRAGPRPGLRLTSEPDLHLVIAGQRVDAVAQRGAAYVFPLPAGHGPVRIVSRAGAPAELGTARDPRTLGVAVRRIVLRQAARFHIVEAADAALSDGFHEFEPAIGLRWTDGDAGLPATLFRSLKGPAELVLHIGGATQYPLFGDTGGRVAA